MNPTNANNTPYPNINNSISYPIYTDSSPVTYYPTPNFFLTSAYVPTPYPAPTSTGRTIRRVQDNNNHIAAIKKLKKDKLKLKAEIEHQKKKYEAVQIVNDDLMEKVHAVKEEKIENESYYKRKIDNLQKVIERTENKLTNEKSKFKDLNANDRASYINQQEISNIEIQKRNVIINVLNSRIENLQSLNNKKCEENKALKDKILQLEKKRKRQEEVKKQPSSQENTKKRKKDSV